MSFNAQSIRETQREKQTETQRDRERELELENVMRVVRETDIQTDRQDRQTQKQREGQRIKHPRDITTNTFLLLSIYRRPKIQRNKDPVAPLPEKPGAL